MLPIPIDNYIPKYKRDSKAAAFTAMIDTILQDIMDEIIQLNRINDPVRCNAIMLDELGYLLNVGIRDNDTETEKRKKIAGAVAAHKLRGTFAYDVKPKIDLIAGGNSIIFRAIDEDDFIFVGDGLTPAAYYWAALGCDGIDTDLGPAFIGSGLEVEQAGNIYIDVDNAALTADEQTAIELDISDSVPAYMIIHIGYVNGLGQFIEYFTMG